MIITSYNQHVRLLSSEPFGWFAPPKSTRAWEPTLFMESLHSTSQNERYRPVSSISANSSARNTPVTVAELQPDYEEVFTVMDYCDGRQRSTSPGLGDCSRRK